ncbi:hypothetical protein LCGC14_0938530 [marine sediment metagenome]|uniref:Uncharacterized protein n=1 Tax=marine sediment metagenome TaxID=412755 RepID=A0A0F9P6V6_9ZZZZ
MSPLDNSALAAMANKDPTQYLRITKMAIRQYLQECLKVGGQFRAFMDKLASYTIGYVINKPLSEDQNERHLQIASYYANMRERPPQIFIQDGGYQYKPDSLGSIAAGWNMQTKDGAQTIKVMDVVPIPIEIHCVTTSQQEVEDLAAFMSLAFGQLQRLTVNYILRPAQRQAGVYWEVRIPFLHDISPKTHTPVHGDPRQQIWQLTCSMTIDFENSVYLQYRSQPQYSPRRGDITLTLPEWVLLGQDHPISLVNRPEPISVYSDDARIAVVQQRGRSWIIQPRRPGTFNLLVTKTHGPQEGSEILAQQEVEVRAR